MRNCTGTSPAGPMLLDEMSVGTENGVHFSVRRASVPPEQCVPCPHDGRASRPTSVRRKQAEADKMADLSGQTAWVTGAGSGIGRAAAAALSGSRARLLLAGRPIEPLQAVAAELEGRGGTVLVEAGDLTDKAAARQMASRIGERFGRLDILVNNAGTNIRE